MLDKRSRAEVVDSEDAVEHFFVFAVFYGPIIYVPNNNAKLFVVLV